MSLEDKVEDARFKLLDALEEHADNGTILDRCADLISAISSLKEWGEKPDRKQKAADRAGERLGDIERDGG